jgi:hypothetical protein
MDDPAMMWAGGPAFPFVFRDGDKIFTGISLRDWFAGQALAALATEYSSNYYYWAEYAYRVADEMIAQRKKEVTVAQS